MRWIFWRNKPSLQNDPGKDSGTDAPEITVFIDTETAASPAPEVRGVILAPPSKQTRGDRFARFPHRSGRPAATRPPETSHGLCSLLHLPQALSCGKHDLDSSTEKRVAYFTHGEYAGGMELIRLMAPSIRRALSAEPPAAKRQPAAVLPPLRTRPKLPPA